MIKMLEGSDMEKAVFWQAVVFPKCVGILRNNHLRTTLVEHGSSGTPDTGTGCVAVVSIHFQNSKGNNKVQSPVFKIG